MSPDTTHKYFTAFKMIGVSTKLQIFRMKGERILEKVSYDHARYDGIAAIVDLARRVPGGFQGPQIKHTRKPNIFKCLLELASWYMTFFPFKPSHWKIGEGSERTSAWTKLDLPEGLSSNELNTILLMALDETSRSYLQRPTLPRMWMVPVSLYEKIDDSIPAGNQVSFIDVRITHKTTRADLRRQIASWLKSQNYWGTLLTLRPAGWVSIESYARFLKNAHQSFRRTGTLTNMGSWEVHGLPEDEWWVFGDGMVALMNPVVGTAMMVNGKLGLSIIFHESIGMSKERAQEFLEEWKTRTMKAFPKVGLFESRDEASVSRQVLAREPASFN